jgi:hypothetical protein
MTSENRIGKGERCCSASARIINHCVRSTRFKGELWSTRNGDYL